LVGSAAAATSGGGNGNSFDKSATAALQTTDGNASCWFDCQCARTSIAEAGGAGGLLLLVALLEAILTGATSIHQVGPGDHLPVSSRNLFSYLLVQCLMALFFLLDFERADGVKFLRFG
jgi:hypothetical protein